MNNPFDSWTEEDWARYTEKHGPVPVGLLLKTVFAYAGVMVVLGVIVAMLVHS